MKQKLLAGILSLVMIISICSGCGGSRKGTGQVEAAGSAVQGKREEGIQITLSDEAITAESTSVQVQNHVITLTEAGAYVFTGTLSQGRIVVDADKEASLELVLNGVDITCSNYAVIQVLSAGEVTIDLAEGSENVLTDGEAYEMEDEEDTTDGVIFSRDDLKLKGDGILYINGYYKHGIVGKDDVKIKGGTYIIQASEDGINANDSLTIDGGTFHITAGDDGMHVDELLTINDGDITIADSYEGLEGHQVVINGGTVDIISSDDGINANSGSDTETGSLNEQEEGTGQPEDGSLDEREGETGRTDNREPAAGMPGDVAPGGRRGDGSLPEGELPEGEVPEEIQPDNRNIDGDMPEDAGGEFDRNAAGDFDENAGEDFGRFGGRMPGGGMGMDTDEDSLLQINGGIITIDAGGDGLDSNGYLEVNGGTVYVSGAAGDGDSAIDYGLKATVTGGTVIAAGFSGMAEEFDKESTQYHILYNVGQIQKAGTTVTVRDSAGNEILSWSPAKEFNCVIISSPDITEEGDYTIEIGEIKDSL